MKVFVAFFFTSLLSVHHAIALSLVEHAQLASAVLEILGSKPNVDNIDDDNLSFINGEKMRYNMLLDEAKKKKALAQTLRESMQRAFGEEVITQKVQSLNEGRQIGQSAELRDIQAFNNAQANLLDKEAELRERDAEKAKELIDSVKLTEEKRQVEAKYCNILKIGPLKAVKQPDQLRYYIDKDTVGQITGTAFTVFYKKHSKRTFFFNNMHFLITDVADSPECFEFFYNGMRQVFCASGKQARNSWIDAMTEAWFCHNLGIKGTLPSIEATEKEEKKIKAIKPPAEKKEQKALYNIEIGVDENLRGHVKINGKEHLKA